MPLPLDFEPRWQRPPAVAQCREQQGATEQEYLNMQLESVDLPFAGAEPRSLVGSREPARFRRRAGQKESTGAAKQVPSQPRRRSDSVR